MNNDKKLALLKNWQEVSKKYTEAVLAYMDVTWCSGEAPHIKTGDSVVDEYTKLVAELTGIPFDELICWLHDLYCGEVASYDVRVDGKWHSARTIEEFFDLWVAINKD